MMKHRESKVSYNCAYVCTIMYLRIRKHRSRYFECVLACVHVCLYVCICVGMYVHECIGVYMVCMGVYVVCMGECGIHM